MTTMSYTARAANGRTIRGRIEAENSQDAIRWLKNNGVQVISVSDVKGIEASFLRWSKALNTKRVKTGHVVATIAQLQLMLDAGTGLDNALSVAADTAQSPRLRSVLVDVHQRVKNGQQLSDALNAHSDVFDQVSVRMIAAGEASGTLSHMLDTLQEMLVRQADLRRSMLIAIMYPAVLVGVACVAVVILFLWVLPKFAIVFEDVGVDLPVITAFMLGLSHFFRAYFVFMVIGLIAAIVGAKLLLTVPSFLTRWLKFLMRVPLVGTIIRFGNTAKSMHIMGTLWESGLPITEVTRLTAATMKHKLYQDFFFQLRERLIDGKQISSSFATTDLFGPTVAPLIRTGEETGKTPLVLGALATYHEKETQGLIKTMITLMEPAIIILMAGAVGVIAISVVVPMFRLSQAVH